MTGEIVTVQNIIVKKFGNRPYEGGTWAGRAWLGTPLILLGNWARQVPSRPSPTSIWSIPEIFIKNILHSDIFPGHSSSLMTLVCQFIGISNQMETTGEVSNIERIFYQ